MAAVKRVEAIPLIAPLLNLPPPPNCPVSPLPPEQQRRRLLATLVEWALGTARVQPTVITTEDLHWADPSTLELIQLLVEQGVRARLLLLYTARPEFRAQWPIRSHHTQITLNRLSARNVRTMVQEVAARAALSEDTITTVVERTGGVPLFVEELTRAVLEGGDDTKRTGREIPVTLHDSLMARLDRLGATKEVIQVGAVLGAEFSYELLHAVHPIDDADLDRSLRTLADAELLYVRGVGPDAVYQFKHALIRDAAYEALLKRRRKDLHRLVAHTIDEQFSAFKEAHPEVLARHWMEAGEPEPAITQWTKAGQAAQGRNAFKEALENYQQALALLNTLPESPERDLRELELRQSIVFTLFITSGVSAPETSDAAERFGALAEKSGNLSRLCIGVLSKGATTLVAGELSIAAALADQGLDLALRERSPISVELAHAVQQQVSFHSGDLVGAEKHFTAWLKFFDDPTVRELPAQVGVLGIAALNAWLLGRADDARQREVRTMAAAANRNPFEVAMSGYLAAYLRLYLRENEQAETLAVQALELCEKHQYPLPAAHSRCALGQARGQLGRAAEGVGLIRDGIAGLLETGSCLGITQLMTYLAVAQGREDATVDALATLDQALQANPNELFFRPETLRLRGELLLKKDQAELAEASFSESIALARSIDAKAWELRATMSLARLLTKLGGRDEARSMLAEIYNWFTEGFDTADLKDAKALLEELGA
jgi:tetratricopeptide (TPR) repeat protein